MTSILPLTASSQSSSSPVVLSPEISTTTTNVETTTTTPVPTATTDRNKKPRQTTTTTTTGDDDCYETDGSEADAIAPKEFICPLTLSVMIDPVLTRHGHNYEREAILKWIARDTGLCPMTRKPLRLSDLITNHQLRTRIHRWRKENDLNIHIIVTSNDLHNIFGYLEIPNEIRTPQDNRHEEDMAERAEDDPLRIHEVRHRRRRHPGLFRRWFRGTAVPISATTTSERP